MGFNNINSLGPDATPASALQEQLGVEPEPYVAGEVEGASGTVDDEESDLVNKVILLPYGTHNGALFIVASGLPEDMPAFDAVLDTLVLDVPQPDVAAIDAAWQSSLAAGEGLVVGDPDAPFTMVEYFSFTCGHCANYTYDVERLIALETEPGDLRVEFEVMILYGSAEELRASHTAYCAAEQGRGYSTYKALFQASSELGQDVAYSADGIQDIISQPELGLDVDAMNECIESERYAANLYQTRLRFIELGLTGTPSVLMAEGQDTPRRLMLTSGQELRGAVRIGDVRAIMDMATDEEEGQSLAEMFPVPPPEESVQAFDEDAWNEMLEEMRNPQEFDDEALNEMLESMQSSQDAAATDDDDDDDQDMRLVAAMVVGGMVLLVIGLVSLVFVSRKQTPGADLLEVEAAPAGDDDAAVAAAGDDSAPESGDSGDDSAL
ncbi:MAG: thioredoxin domain-containing protein [Chloroflexi bacterium]|nr:thioredoxin domain-containing protein [Chloroflexota bacterium]